MDKQKGLNNFPILNVPTSFFNVATCKVEACRVQREFETETCQPKLQYASTLHVATVTKEVVHLESENYSGKMFLIFF